MMIRGKSGARETVGRVTALGKNRGRPRTLQRVMQRSHTPHTHVQYLRMTSQALMRADVGLIGMNEAMGRGAVFLDRRAR